MQFISAKASHLKPPNMKLASARIKNFKSIKDVRVDFEPACRVLVGINESGKTNILKALHLMGRTAKPNVKEDLRDALPHEEQIEESYIKFYFNYEKAEADMLFTGVSSQILSASKNPDIVSVKGKNLDVRNVCANTDTGLYTVNILEEEKLFQFFRFDQGWELLDGWQKPTKACPETFRTKIKTDEYPLAKYRLVRRRDLPEVPDAYLENASIDDLQRLVGATAIQITNERLPETLFWEYNEDNILPNSIGIAEFASDPSACVPLRNMFALAGIADITKSLLEKSSLTPNQFQNYLDNIARKTTAHFRDVWKDYKNIEFSLRANGDRIVPGIKEKNIHDFGRRSDGFKRFVTFLLLISVDVKNKVLKNTVLLIDEPDTSLHPSGARYLRDELIRISKTNYVLYSTHSIFMIDSGDIGRHYIVQKRSEITTVESAEESNIADEEVLYNALGHLFFQ